MRSTQLTRLVFIVWVALGLWTGSLHAGNKGRPDKRANASNAVSPVMETWTDRVEGRDDDPDVAEELALRKAQNSLAGYLRQQPRKVHWVPSKEYIKAQLLARSPEHIELSDSDDPKGKGRHLVVLDLRVTDDNYRDIVRQDRQQRERERHGRIQERTFMASKLVAGLVAILAALAGYFRLEEATKGYYTTWLRVGAIGFVLAVGAALLRVG